MTTITFDSKKHVYHKLQKLFSMSERDVTFDTSYEIVNPKTGNSVVFNFTHSTGPEFDPETKYIYKSDDGLTLEVVNDKHITKVRAQMYLEAKTRY